MLDWVLNKPLNWYRQIFIQFHSSVLGHLHLIGKKSLHLFLFELSKKYGNIFSLQLGQRKAIVITSHDLLQEALIKKGKIFASRPDFPLFRYTRNGRNGISLCPYSNDYITNRKLAIKSLHSTMKGKEDMAEMFQVEMKKMTNMLDAHLSSNESFYPLEAFQKIVPSLFLALMFGQHYDYNDKEFLEKIECYEQWFENAEADNPADFFPVLEYFPNYRLDLAAKLGKLFESFALKEMEKDSNYNTTIYSSILKSENVEKDKAINDKKLEKAKVISDLLGGGFDTVASLLTWALIYFSEKPDVITKCREELENTSYNLTVKQYENKFPYFYSVISELLRYTTVAPLGLFRETTEDVHFHDYLIEKGTILIPHLWSVNRDPTFWKYPNEFNPENFYCSKTNEIDKKALKYSIAFADGVRKCPGYEVAQKMLCEILKTFIIHYDVTVTKPPEDLLPKRGLTLKPKYYEVKLQKKLKY